MSTDLITFDAEQKSLIKATLARNCTDTEFAMLLYQAKTLQLDPLRKQIWAVKFADQPALIFVGRDGYLQIAHRSGQFDGMESGTRAEGTDTIGWAKVYRKDMGHPFVKEVRLSEYDKKQGNWKVMPHTMIQKVAECFDGETRILTKEGFHKISELKENTKVAQVDENNVVTFVKPEKIIAEEYSGKMYQFTNTKCAMCVTPDHRVVTTYGIMPAKELVEILRLRKFPEAIRTVSFQNQKDYPISDELIKFMAAYTADGYRHDESMLAISVSKERKIQFLTTLGLHTNIRDKQPDKKTGKVTQKTFFYPAAVRDKMFDFVDYSMDKYIDVDSFMMLSERQIRLFIDTVLFFDGYSYHKQTMFSTVRDQHLYAIETLAVCAGYCVERHPDAHPRFTNNPVHRLAINDIKNVPLRKQYWKTVDYTGKIYCVTVPTGKVIVMRDGYSHVSGNSQALRAAFAISGVYSPEEFGEKEPAIVDMGEIPADAIKSKNQKKIIEA